MHLTAQEVRVENLEIGMFVSKLDVPWLKTPFPIQGFEISKREELELLSAYCNKVYIDKHLSKIDVTAHLYQMQQSNPKKKQLNPKIIRLMNERAKFKPSVEQYPAFTQLNKEIKDASVVYDEIISGMSKTYRYLECTGHISVPEVKRTSSKMVGSIIKNPNALAWLCRLSSDNDNLYHQAVRSAIWGLIFGRSLGLSRSNLKNIATALLLAPIGKTKLDPRLLLKRQNQQQANRYQQHIELTLKETQKIFSPGHQINHIIAAHCERNNGTGYPRSLAGNKIPFSSRIAGIASYYEELINPYPGVEAMTPVEAISQIYNSKNSLFQREIVEAFIQAIGIYPTGSLVKLSDNSVGIIVEQPKKSRLRPKVAIIKDPNNLTLSQPKVINLADPRHPLQIETSLKSSVAEINTHELHKKLFENNSWLSYIKSFL